MLLKELDHWIPQSLTHLDLVSADKLDAKKNNLLILFWSPNLIFLSWSFIYQDDFLCKESLLLVSVAVEGHPGPLVGHGRRPKW